MEFIRLGGDRTNTKLVKLFLYIIRGLLNTCIVFRVQFMGDVFAESRPYYRKAYNKTVKAAGILNFNLHDLRHCAMSNLRLAGNDHFVINQASGAKTDSAFRRNNLLTEEEMKSMKGLDVQGG